ncbi:MULTISPECIES: hypothetical protein [Nocardia]|uniref:hypothetical protein n=1 Tax=Nocardia TaxID=1817 RepID=UPI000D69E808|nr:MULTISPECIES: hypothetical protein [Nocardia]
MTDDLGTQVAIGVAQGLAAQLRSSTDFLLAPLKHDSDRWQVLTSALRDFADQADSRDVGDRLYALLLRIESLDEERAAEVSRRINYWNDAAPRINLDAEWSH